MTSVSLKNDYRKKIAVNTAKTKYNDKFPTNEDGVTKRGAFTYSRVSLILDKEKKLTGESISLDHQDRQIADYCESHNLVIVGKYSDPNVSGKSIEGRKGLQDMFEQLRKGIVVVCASISRLSRNTEDLLCINRIIMEHGAELVIVDVPMALNTISGEAYLGMIGTMVTMERKQNNLKISQCMANAAKEGKLITCPKFGYGVVNKQYVLDEEEQKVIEYIKALLEYDSSLATGPITRELKEQGFLNKKGKPISFSTVQSIIRELKNPTMPAIMEKQRLHAEAKLKKII